VDFLPEKNMYPNAYMDFLSGTKFTFSIFQEKKSPFIHPAITQIWAGPRTKSEKEVAASPKLFERSKIGCFFFFAAQKAVIIFASSIGWWI